MRNVVICLLMSLSFIFTQEVVVWISAADDSHIELSISNTTGVSGFQFTIIADPTLGAVFGEAYGGAAEEAGFMMSSNPDGLLIGFSLLAEEIAPGDSIVLANMSWTIPEDVAGYLTIELIPNSFTGGDPPVALNAVEGNPYLYGDNIVFGCTYPDALNFDPNATVEDGSCVYPPNAPVNFTADGGYTEISLEWDYENLSRDTREQITLYVSEIQDDGAGNANILIYLDNPDVPIYGFQFKIFSEANITVNGAYGGRADLAEFMVVTNESGLVLGFSLTGGYMAPGTGTMTILEISYPEEELGLEAIVTLDETYPDNIFSTMDGDDIYDVSFEWIPINWTVGENFEFDFVDECGDGLCTGYEDYFTCPEDCPPPEELTFNVYRDGVLYESGIEAYDYTDTGLGYLESYCYMVTAYDGAYESDSSNEDCATTDPLGADIDVAPDFLSADLFTGDTDLQTLTISNSGDDNLIWSTTIEEVENVSRNAFNPEEIKRDVRIHPEGEIVTGELIVRYRSNITNSQRDRLTRMLTITREKSFDDLNLFLYKYESDWMIEDIIAYLNKFENVLYAEPSYKVHTVQTIPDDPFFDQQWGMHNTGQSGGVEDADLDGPEAWDVETGNEEIVVGIIDTGVDYNHEDLQGNIWTNSSEIPNNGIDDDDNGYIDDYYGYDFANYDSDPWDDNGHGTHCAGVVTAAGDNGIGVAGVNWNAKVAAIKFLSAGGGGSTEGAIEAVLYANLMDIHMTSNSWGGGPYSEGLKDAIEFGEKLFIAAAGNSMNNNDANPFYPATYDSDNIISVAAIDRYDQLVNEGWWGSSYGLNTVDVAAAGLDVFSTFPTGAYLSEDCMDGNGDGYGFCSGTSMATPHVAGVAALALGRNPEMDWMLTKQIVMDSAVPTPGLDGYCVTGARVNAYNAVIMVQPQWVEVIPENGVVAPGGSMDVDVVFNAEGLYGGDYQANINFASNDPDEPVVVVGTILSVTGAPSLSIDQNSLDFGEVFVDGNLSLYLNILNNGTDVLDISELSTDNELFTLSDNSVILQPEESLSLEVIFAPAEPIDESGILTIFSNDPSNPVVEVSLTGAGVLPPDIAVTPDSYAEDMFTGDIVTETMFVTNEGSADLIVELSVENLDEELRSSRTINTAGSHYRTATDTPISNNTPHHGELTFREEYSGDYLNFGITDYGEIMPLQFNGNEFLAVGSWMSGYTVGYMDFEGGTWVYYTAYDSWYGIYPVSYTELVNDEDEVVVEVITQTEDGALIITRTFTFERSEKFVQIHTILESQEGLATQAVIFKTFADWDIDDDYDDDSFDYDLERNMVYAWDNNYGGITAEYVPAFMDLDGWGDYSSYNTFVDYPDGPINFFDGFGISHFDAGDLEGGDTWEITTAFVAGESLEALQESADDALNYVSTDWLSVEPESLVVPSGVTIEVEVIFNAEGLYGGEYNANILLENNDPDESLVIIPAFMTVTGAPSLAVDPTSLDFGDVFVDGSVTLEVNIENNGTDLLTVSSIVSDNADFTADIESINLNPEEDYDLHVTFAPSFDGDQSGTITMLSNDPSNPEVTITLTGTGLLPPDISVDPLSISADLFTGDIDSSQVFTISNTGFSDLTWQLEIIEDEELLTGSGDNTIFQSSEPLYIPSGEYFNLGKEDHEIYIPNPNADMNTMDVSRDEFGYEVYDNEDGIEFEWIDISDIGTYVFLGDDDSEWAPLGFDMPFYENEFSGINIGSNGWLSFTYSGGWIWAEWLPSVNAPENVIAVYALDGYPTGNCYYYSDGENFVVTWEDWGYYGDFEPRYDMQAILSANGDMKLQYREIEMNAWEWNGGWRTVGIQNNDQDDGITYMGPGSEPDIYDELAVLFSLNEPNQWIFTDIESGIIPAGEAQDVQVTFNAGGLYGGEYIADIVINSNDPDDGPLTVEASLNVTGAPNLAVDPASLDFGDVFVDGSVTLEVNIENNGTDLLIISSIESDNSDFSSDVSSINLDPETSFELQVTFAPTFDGGQSGSITLLCNDPSNPEVTVSLAGTGLLPPDIDVTPESMSADLFTGDTEVQVLTILNDGDSDLLWDITASFNDVSNRVNPLIDYPENTLDEYTSQSIFSGITHYSDSREDLELVAIIQNIDPWGSNAWQVELEARDISYEIRPTSDLLTMDYNEYDMIITSGSDNIDSGHILEAADLIYDYVENGGIAAVSLCSQGLTGNFGGISFEWFSSNNTYILDPEHPLVSGVPSPALGSSSSHTYFTSFPEDWNALTENELGEVNSVYKDGFFVFGLTIEHAWVFYPDQLGPMIGNVIDWAMEMEIQNDWLSFDIESGTVLAGESQEVLVTFDATGLYGGEYNADILVSSNDPDEATVVVPATLFVTGAPNLAVDQNSLDFGEVFVDGSVTLEVNIENNGTDLLIISSIESDNTDFTVDIESINLDPEEDYDLHVTFAPSFDGGQSGSITLLCNDPSNPEVTVSLAGTGLLPPVIVVTPDALAADLYTGDLDDQNLNVANTGSSDLNFEVEVEFLDDGMFSNNYRGIIHPSSPEEFASISRQREISDDDDTSIDTNSISENVSQNHNSEEILFDRDGNLLETGEFLFSFPDYSGNANAMGIAFDGNNYYVVGGGYSSGEVAQMDAEFNLVSTQEVELDCRGVFYNPNDGDIYITGYTSNGLFRLNTDPFDGGYETVHTDITQYYQSNLVISPDGTLLYDQYFGNVNVYDFESGTLVDNFTLNPYFSDYHPAAYQLAHTGDYLLTASGNTLYGYDSETGELMGQCDTGFFGSEYSISYTNGMFMMTNTSETDWYAYLIDDGSNLYNNWLSVEPETGIVPADGNMDLTTHFDATGLYGGEYHANINLMNNDPTNPTAVVSVTLIVTGAPNLAIDPTNLNFGDVYVDGSSTFTVTVENNGTDLLFISSIESDNSDFTTDVSSLELDPEEDYDLQVTFAPSFDGDQVGTITLLSNDPSNPEVTISLSGTGQLPPDIDVAPTSVSANLYTGEIDSSQTLIISNLGFSQLDYNIEINFGDDDDDDGGGELAGLLFEMDWWFFCEDAGYIEYWLLQEDGTFWVCETEDCDEAFQPGYWEFENSSIPMTGCFEGDYSYNLKIFDGGLIEDLVFDIFITLTDDQTSGTGYHYFEDWDDDYGDVFGEMYLTQIGLAVVSNNSGSEISIWGDLDSGRIPTSDLSGNIDSFRRIAEHNANSNLRTESATGTETSHPQIVEITRILPDVNRDDRDLPSVLLLNTYIYESLPWASELEATVVDFWEYDAPLDVLMEYDIVIVGSNYAWLDPVEMGDILAEYVDEGGSLIMLAATFHGFGAWALSGTINTTEYNPLQHADYSCCADTQWLSDAIDHPIMNDVNEIWTNLWAYTAPQGSGVSLGIFGNGYEVGAYNPDKNIIALNIFSNGPVDNEWFGGDFVQLMNNSLNWLSGNISDWLSISPDSGSIEDWDTGEIMVTFDATGLYGGEYNADIVIFSNDPDEAEFVVPATLFVTGAPNLSLNVTDLNFGDVFVDGSLILEFTITNNGTDILEVYDILSELNDFTQDVSSVTLEPEESQLVSVTFAPTVDGDQFGEIIITSNDPGSPELVINISGTGLLPPDIETAPESLSVNLFTGDIDSSHTVTITNVGYSELIYTVNVESSALSAPSSFGQSSQSNLINRDNSEMPARDSDRQPWSGNHITDNSESIDHLDWLIREMPDSNVIFYDDMENGDNGWTTEVYSMDDLWHRTDRNYNSPEYSWWCGLEGSGTYSTGWFISTAAISPTINLTDIDTTVTLQFYENYETEAGWDFCMVDVSTDGGSSWESLRGGYGSAPSGSSGGWISSTLDLTPYAGSQINLRFYFDTGDEIYNDFPGWFFDDIVVYTNQIPWLDVSEDSGVLAPGESDEVTVFFDASGLFGGDYYGEVQIYSNDPDESLVIIPAFLNVTGAPGIAIDPVEVYFDSTAAGDVNSIPIIVTNTGTDLLVISDINSDNDLFSANPSSFSVEVNDDRIVNILFAPETSGLEMGTLVIVSNDPSNAEVFLSVSGLGIIVGCTDPEAINYNPEANVEDGSCIYRPNPPEDLLAVGGEDAIVLTWDYDISETDDPVKVFISEVSDDGAGNVTMGLNMVNEVGVSGWQFMLDPGVDLIITNAYGGRAEEANHLISYNEDGLILGFSMDLTLVEPGEGVLIYLDAEYDLSDAGFLTPLDHIYEDDFGNRLTVFVDELGFEVPYEWVVTHWEVGSNILITTDITFNVYRDGELIAGGIPNTVYSDSDLTHGVEYCYVVLAFDGAYESEPSNTACAEVELSTVTQAIEISAFSMNMISGSVLPDPLDIEEVMMDNDLLIMSNDGGGFFVPDFGINSIGDWSESDGYQIFLSGTDDQVLNITGEPVDENMSLLIEAFSMNIIPYFLQEPMSSEAAFGDYYDDILLVKDDSGNFFVPGFAIISLDTLQPGEGYAIFLSSNEDIVFQYTGGGELNRIPENTIWDVNTYLTELEYYEIQPSGISYPVILHSLSGMVETGDELAVYANNTPVGAVKITSPDHPVVIPVWEGFSGFGIELPGFTIGDEIEFRLWSQSEDRELHVEADLSSHIFGDAPLTSGNAVVYNMSAVPEVYKLSEPYPNPFNAATRINFALPSNSNVKILVYDMLGKEVISLVNKPMETGYHTVIWNAERFSSGLYFIHFTAGGIQKTQKVLLIK